MKKILAVATFVAMIGVLSFGVIGCDSKKAATTPKTTEAPKTTTPPTEVKTDKTTTPPTEAPKTEKK